MTVPVASLRGEPIAFAEVWERALGSHGERSFLVFEGPDGSVAEWSYAEFDSVVARVAAELGRLGAGPGRAVHLCLANSPAFVAVWLAAIRLGAWIVPSDPHSRTPELADHIARTDPAVCFGAAERIDQFAPACGARPLWQIDEADTAFAWLPDLAGRTPSSARPSGESQPPDRHEASGLPDRPSPMEPTAPMAVSPARTAAYRPEPLDRAAVMFTSGTTGRPKGVEITQANYAFAGRVMAAAAGLSAEDRYIVVLPLFHANAQYYSFASAITVGASVALMHAFSASGFLAQCARHGATCASLFAAPMRMILARGRPLPGVSLRHCWFAQNISDDQYDTISDWLGCAPRQLYGMTETIPAVLSDSVEHPRHHTMGRPTQGCVVDLHDAEGEPVPGGEVGEIVVGGEPGVTLFAGYLDDPETTAASLGEGWFRTGDRARRDPDGRFVFDGRHADVLKVAGENVSVTEIEAVLSAHPDVLEAAVVGRPDPIRDEVPVAFAVPAVSEMPPSPDDLRAWCAERLAKSKVPAEVTLLAELPRTSVGKIRKFVLRETAHAPPDLRRPRKPRSLWRRETRSTSEMPGMTEGIVEAEGSVETEDSRKTVGSVDTVGSVETEDRATTAEAQP